MANLPCPFCDFSDSDAYFLTQHVELCHPENGESPFIVRDSHDEARPDSNHNQTHGESQEILSQDDSDEEYVDCPHKCGENLLVTEIPSHMDMHVAEGIALEDTAKGGSEDPVEEEEYPAHIEANFTTHLPRALRNRDTNRSPKGRTQTTQGPKGRKSTSIMDKLQGVADDQASSKSKGKDDRVQRLGKKELGPYAYEEQMPTWLRKLLEESSQPIVKNTIGPNGTLIKVENLVNETADIIPVLAQLCEQDRSVREVFFCNPAVRHVCKIDREGGFCGYRNLQMLISYIRYAQAEGFEHFQDGSPSIFKLQNMIENAWDSGYNDHGRIETGGIKGTRKYIGTPEAQAVFDYLGIRCEAGVFSQTKDASPVTNLLDAIEDYFRSGSVSEKPEKVRRTFLPPIYFQHQGLPTLRHSLTIVGIELKKNGAVNLLVFDPIFKVSPGVTRLLGAKFTSPYPDRLLKAYRRGDGYLRRYRNFEILKLNSPYEDMDD